MKLSLIIPVKNENEKVLNKILKECQRILKKYGDYEIIIISKYDMETPNFMSHQRIRKIGQKNDGKGNAIKIGAENSKGDILIFMDGDGSHIPMDIPKLIEPIRKGNADFVLASRMLGGSEELHGDLSQFFRLVTTSLISLIVYYRFGTNISDTQNGFRAIRKVMFESLDLKANNFDIETEMVMKCLKRKYRILEIPSRELKRVQGKSRINLFKQWRHYVWRILVNLF
jgi:glycosyltransferase involved in cell wall biosynthesis